MQIQNYIKIVFFAAFYKIFDKCKNAFSVFVRLLLNNDLVKTETNVVHTERCDIFNIVLGYVSVKMLKISDSKHQSPVLGQYIKSFVVRQPAADSHSFFKACKFFHIQTLTAVSSIIILLKG